MLEKSKIALEVRNQALNIIETATDEHKTFEITQEKQLLMAIMFADSEVERATAGSTQAWKEMRKNLGIASGSTNLYSKQTVLLIGFMLEDSKVADKVRKLVLANDDIFEPVTVEPITAEPIGNVGTIVVPIEQPKPTELQVVNHNEQLVIDSRDVAEMIAKRHDHLLRDIKRYVEVISESPNLGSQDFFIPSTYKTTGNNKTYECYLLTKKGCDMVANKMTGDKGILFTATYVTRFEEMENQLKSQALVPVHSYMINDPIKRAEQWIVEYKEKVVLAETVEKQNEVIEEQTEVLKTALSRIENQSDVHLIMSISLR